MMNKEKYISELNTIKASDDFQQKTVRLLKNPTGEESRDYKKKKKRPLKFVLVPAFAVVLVCALLFSNVFSPVNTVQASENLMDGITPNKLDVSSSINKDFINPAANFSVNLFQKSVKKDTNSLISPVSVYLALGMTANGAGGNTLKQFENMLGGGLSINELNHNYYNLTNKLESIKDGKLQIANSIWYRNQNLKVEKGFLQKNADYFGAGAFQLDFTKKAAVNKINNWVKENTNGKIDKMVDKIDDNTVMYLINTLYFEADWMKGYLKPNVSSKEFHAPGGTVSTSFMFSEEKYIHDEKADGMVKPFKDDRFAFAAILPKTGTSLENYISQMTGDSFLKLMNSSENKRADCWLPKFKYEYKVDLNDPLKSLGLTDAFDGDTADFKNMGSTAQGNIYIGDVLHKTFIEVDEAGTKAGAATSVSMATSSSMPVTEPPKIVFDRPFVYAIIDTQTKLPVFIGTVNDPTK